MRQNGTGSWRRYAPFWKSFGVRVAMQNDINGFPWGLLPKLHQHGIDAVGWAAIATRACRSRPAPDAWWWEGPDGKRMLAWSGTHYCFGFELFHASEWRRGPVPSATDVWYNPPRQGETWKTSKEDLDASEQILRKKLAKMDHYRHPCGSLPSDKPLADGQRSALASDRRFRQGMERRRAAAETGDVDPEPLLRAATGYFRGPNHATVRAAIGRTGGATGLHRSRAARRRISRQSGSLADLPAAARMLKVKLR